MKLKNILAGVAASVALTGVAVAQPHGMGPGMMGGYGGLWGPILLAVVVGVVVWGVTQKRK